MSKQEFLQYKGKVKTLLKNAMFEVELENGIIYSQKIGKGNGDSDHFSREKTYSFSKQGTVLAKETLTLGFYKDTVFLKMLADVGFKHLGMADAEKFFILEKVA